MMVALEAGAEDIQTSEEGFEIFTAPSDFIAVKEALEEAGLETVSAEVEMIPTMYTQLSDEQAEAFEKMLEALEDDDDVQDVYHNASEE